MTPKAMTPKTMTPKTMTLKAIAGIILALLATTTSQAVWIGATTGNTVDAAHNYTNTANWAGGIIDDDFTGVTLTGATTLYFTGDHATGPNGLNTSYAGPYDLTLRGYGGDRTLKLNGPFTHQSVVDKTLVIGATDNGLILDLGETNRTFQMGIDTAATGGGLVTMTRGLVSNGGIVKMGRRTLNLNVEQPYAGPTIVNMGSLTLNLNGSISNSAAIHVKPVNSAA